MPNYNLGNLAWDEFQSLVGDLLSLELGVPLERFGPGPDGGIDLRYVQGGNKLVVQCKHAPGRPASSLIPNLRNRDLPHVMKVKPTRYLIATSANLTPSTKDRIVALFTPFIQDPQDVLGAQDIEALLRKHPTVEKSHLKLWLNSRAALDAVIHNDALARAAAVIERIHEEAPLYVPNASYDEAQRLLSEFHVCIISGPAGIGKTMLADMLLIDHVARGWSPIHVSADINEAFALWNETEGQFIFYDDFLGRTSLAELLGKNEDRRLAELLRRVHSRDNKRLILTTREYLLENARSQYDLIDRIDLDPMICIVDLARYTRAIRAKILFNHLFFANVPHASLQRFVAARGWKEVIDHQNYNPRMIQTAVERAARATEGDINLGQILLQELNNPQAMWTHILTSQLSQAAASFLMVMTSLPTEVLLEDAAKAWQANAQPVSRHPDSYKRFESVLRELEGTFITISRNAGAQTVAFQNGSIRDWALEIVSSRPQEIVEIIEHAVFFEQVELLWRYAIDPVFYVTPNASAEARRHSSLAIGQALLRNPRVTIDVVRGLIHEPSCSLSRWKIFGSLEMRRDRVRIEQRLEVICSIDAALPVRDLGQIIEDELRTFPTLLKTHYGDKEAAIGLYKHLLDHDSRYVEKIFVTSLVAWVTQDLTSVEDFVQFIDLRTADPSIVTKENFARVQQEFIPFAKAEAEAEISGDDMLSVWEQTCDDLRYVASQLEVDIQGTIFSIEERIKELHESLELMKPDDARVQNSNAVSSSAADSDAAMDGLFAALLQ